LGAFADIAWKVEMREKTDQTQQIAATTLVGEMKEFNFWTRIVIASILSKFTRFQFSQMLSIIANRTKETWNCFGTNPIGKVFANLVTTERLWNSTADFRILQYLF
jgi:hypothetical protein